MLFSFGFPNLLLPVVNFGSPLPRPSHALRFALQLSSRTSCVVVFINPEENEADRTNTLCLRILIHECLGCLHFFVILDSRRSLSALRFNFTPNFRASALTFCFPVFAL